MKTSSEFIEREMNDCRMKSLITVCFTPVLLLKFLRHVYVYFLAYDIIMLQLPGILFFSEQELRAAEYRRNSISSQHGSRFSNNTFTLSHKGIDFSAYFHFVHNFKK